MKLKLDDILIKIFLIDSISFFPNEISNKELEILQIHDVNNFIKDCYYSSKNHKICGNHRKHDWERGWSGDGVYYSDDERNNIPFYFKKNTHVRFDHKVYKDVGGFAELDLLQSLQFFLFKTFLPSFDSKVIIEYGFGTGSNINFLKRFFSEYSFYGAEWVDSAIEQIIKRNILPKEKVFLTNYFDENTFQSPPEPYIMFTNASLEQCGANYQKFMDYQISNEFCLGGIHIEPVRELLDINEPLNKQSYDYMHRRGYLDGYLEYLKTKSINLLLTKDYGIGSKYLSGYQAVVWKK